MAAESIDIAVVGAGAAGVATCWALVERGLSVRVFDGGLGATSLAGGAIDDRPWEELARAATTLRVEPLARPVGAEAARFVAALGLHRLGDEGASMPRVATPMGRFRIARGHDRALLDLSRLADGARVLVPRVPRAEWDADALARAWSADDYARARGFELVSMDAELTMHLGEARIASADLAALHDDDARVRWLGARLLELVAREGRADALLLGPWLGATHARAEALTQQVGVPVGEAMGEVGGAAGLRFEAARSRLFERIAVSLEREQVHAAHLDDAKVELTCESGATLRARAVVLAIGGVASGGIVFDPPERHAGRDAPSGVRAPFRTSLAAPVTLAAAGRVFDVGSSLFGPALEREAWPTDADPGLLECVGVACRGARVGARLFAAGDVIADRPRTFLEAASSGIVAADAVLGALRGR